MVLLLFASSGSGRSIFDKVDRLRRLKAARRASSRTPSGPAARSTTSTSAGEDRPQDPMAAVFVAAMREWRRSGQRSLAGGETLRARLQERIERAMDVTIGREMERLER